MIFNNRPGLILASLCLLLGASSLFAQSAQVSGSVTDSQKAAVPHATIEITNQATQITQTVISNGAGLYVLPSLLPGKYRITISAPGFETQAVDDVTITVAAKLSLNTILHPGNVNETVTVDGSGVEINTTDGAVSTVIDRQFVQNIPLNGRSFQSLLTLAPGTSQVPSAGAGFGGEITVNGQRTEGNYFLVDGVSANNGAVAVSGSNIGYSGGFSGSTPSATALGTTQNLVSIDALQEFRALTSTYSAEYGRSPGGQFVFNTRSGTNQWHGTAFDYLRNGAMDANSWFSNHTTVTKQQERQNDFGGVFSGPLFRDKTFFFASYEGLRLTTPAGAAPYAVPSATLRASAPEALQPFLSSFPTPTTADQGNGLAFYIGAYSAPSKIDTGSIRIDHSFSERFHIFARYSQSDSDSESRFIYNPAQINATSVSSRSLTLGTTNTLSNTLVNEFRLNIARNDSSYQNTIDTFGGAQPFSQADVGLSPTSWEYAMLSFDDQYAVDGFEPQNIRQRPLNIVDSVTKSAGRHTLRFGVDYRRTYSSQPQPPVYEYNIFASQDSVLANAADYAGAYVRSGFVRPVYTNFSLYAQDEWKVNTRLNLSLGLRWDLNPAPKDRDGNNPYTVTSADLATTTLAQKGAPLWNTSYRNFAPRLGFAYKVNDRAGQETVVRGGIGLFYDPGNVQASQGYSGIGIAGVSYYAATPFPLTDAQLAGVPDPSTESPYTAGIYAFDPNLKSPYTMQWNFAVEQSLGKQQSLLINYVGSTGNDLLMQKEYYPETFGNTNFSNGNGLYLTTNSASSSYHAMQVQFTRRLSAGLQALLSYTWAKSIDDTSSNFQIYTSERGPSDFDIRHNFQAAVTYDIPGHLNNTLASAVLNHWAFDTRVIARSALPVDLIGTSDVDPHTGGQTYFHPNRVLSQPVYIANADAPGGRLINSAAFTTAYAVDGITPTEGNSGRNSVRAFDAVQADVALRREFPFTERVGLQFRAEAFNVFNHAIFGAITNTLQSGTANTSQLTGFGIATNLLANQLGGLNSLYQSGGPRSLQLALKLHF